MMRALLLQGIPVGIVVAEDGRYVAVPVHRVGRV